jgi:hypothetical protein
MKGFWTCQRRSLGVKCGHRNPNRKRLCEWCKKPRPARKRPAHMSALALPYDYYVALNGGERCGICGAAPKPGKKLHRDHDHRRRRHAPWRCSASAATRRCGRT